MSNEREQRIMIKLAIFYGVGAFLTFGLTFNSFDCTVPNYPMCEGDRGIASTMAGIFWPVYQAARFSIYVTGGW